MREDQHAELPLRHRLARLGIDALHEHVVLRDVDPGLGDALAGEGGPDLGQTVVVERVDAEPGLDLGARYRGLGPGLAAECPEPQREGAPASIPRSRSRSAMWSA